MPKESKEEKAVRILLRQGVRFATLTPTVAFASVRGDSDDYECWRDERGKWACTCPYGRHSCSHILAADTVFRAALPTLKGDNHGK